MPLTHAIRYMYIMLAHKAHTHMSSSHMCYVLSPDSPQMFNISILPAVNSPLDVYFLFDLSASLTDDLTSFNNLIENISMSHSA